MILRHLQHPNNTRVCLMIGLSLAAVLALRPAYFVARGHVVDTVVDRVETVESADNQEARRGPSKTHYLYYRYAIDGQPFEGGTSECLRAPLVGQKIRILVLKNDPSASIVAEPLYLMRWPGLVVIGTLWIWLFLLCLNAAARYAARRKTTRMLRRV